MDRNSNIEHCDPDLLFRKHPTPMWICDVENYTIVEINQSALNLYGYSEEEMLGLNIYELQFSGDQASQIAKLNESDRSQIYKHRKKNGAKLYVRLNFSSIGSNGKSYELTTIKDVSREVQSKIEHKLLIENSLDGIMLTNPNGTIYQANEAACRILGMTEEEITRLGREGIVRKDKKLQEALERRKQTGIFFGELTFVHKSGHDVPVELSTSVFTNLEGKTRSSIMFRDITDRMQREKELQESLHEKNTLLMEIHHRVKNNLAIVSGIMELQAMEEQDERVRLKLQDGISRIQSMATIHKLLYQSDSFSRIDLDDNIQKLVANILDTFQIETEPDVNYDLDHLNLNINQAIPCSLIINEVVTNVLKHAFTKEDQGTLWVKLKVIDEQITLKISDNGKGLPPNFGKPENRTSLGLQLIDTLSTQLQANYYYESLDVGACFTLTFDSSNSVKGSGNSFL